MFKLRYVQVNLDRGAVDLVQGTPAQARESP
jgi:hypothetical protein